MYFISKVANGWMIYIGVNSSIGKYRNSSKVNIVNFLVRIHLSFCKLNIFNI
ncbi:hypothetical protein TFUB20_00068 [Tannerella forsythia]|uniref:Uncharacterized protein n=1 Tax=Tannerella forsythia TaxID=28112 RepID=A0A1D3UBX1_TANFO|nr:hypothetical protein TFUB20_00068 [Tannerella forsythia]